MLNVVALQGRLARDPELRQTATGKSVATFTLACDRGRKDASGRSLTDWVPVIAWEQRADFAYKWLTKGQMVTVDGRIQPHLPDQRRHKPHGAGGSCQQYQFLWQQGRQPRPDLHRPGGSA